MKAQVSLETMIYSRDLVYYFVGPKPARFMIEKQKSYR